ncbi:uncharacterized protein DNG_06694 [Cephalotrichum gorgonifer]|uniref:SET domain-containing protein n=1 Tax=Cephalotrichum gorgonifer TaxID=2041049 RepID=A0AAE8N060_9PEZI|nr:uncharacterized protein DNG_06694 [Cephalotrichum gorgonifer]
MARLSTLGIGLLSHAAGLARGFEPLSHGEAETAALTAGLGQCGPFPPGPLERTNPTCAPSLIEDFGTDPADWLPWTHRPYCADTPYCVFTNAHFHGNNGISIITTPALAAHTLDTIESTFASPFRQAFLDPEGRPAYEVRDIPGKGKGAVAVRTIRKGERFMVDYAGIIADTDFPAQLKMADGRKLLEAAVDQLPRMEKIRDLARSTDTQTRVVEDLLRTNSFGMTVEERNVMGLFPEISHLHAILGEDIRNDGHGHA